MTEENRVSSYSLSCCNIDNCNYATSNSNGGSSSSVTSCYYGSVVSGTIPGFYPYTPTKQLCSNLASTEKTGDNYCVVCY